MDGHSLLLAFDTNDPQFARGVELGRLWTLACEHPERELVEMAIRIGEATGREFQAEELGGDWIEVRFGVAAEDAVDLRSGVE